MIKKTAYLFLILLLISCGSEGKKRVKKPSDLISKNTMVDIIYDMSIISAAKGVNRKLMEQEGLHPEKYIYDKYNIDSVQFAQSNEYYAFDLDAYEQIYSKVKVKLENNKKLYSDLVQIEQKQKDSINKIQRQLRDSLREQRQLGNENLEGINLLDIDKSKIKPLGRIKNVDSLMKLKRREN